MSATTLVGLDIGSTSIRAVEATITKDRPVITNFGQAFLSNGDVVSGVIKDGRAVTNTLRQLWSSHNFTTRDVVVGVTHQQVIVREVDVSNLSPKELKRALPFLVRDVLPLPPEEAVLDFYPLAKPEKGDATVHGLLIAVPKDPVLDAVRVIEDAGLHVEHVDLSCFAALRASAHLAGDTEALLDIGANATSITVHTDGTPKIVRTIPRGGAEITALVATRLGVTVLEAEKLKCKIGLGGSGIAGSGVAGSGPIGSGSNSDDVECAEVVAEAIRPLVTEIRNSLNYFSTANPEDRVRRLALVGGAALLPGLPDLLTEQFGLRAFLSDPLQRVGDLRNGGRHDVLARMRSSAAVSIGLTLGAA